ncbi:phosphatase regulatory subunit, putative [Rhizoctonia solani AG-3 Rhs1AP]|uniref:Phosphatase regulatory subunit, putative n=2 Tax=Rhizoctonia solani AG-3 TaxID=1086053 RepID=X8JT87_9AGAM|nr:phosphatase regulatory subunit, putative [Rhizoctonia solani AG-3 Rhs1AP]KEP55354.1 putative phosphatase regulatory subunit [Rhizoctonia solani 123E]
MSSPSHGLAHYPPHLSMSFLMLPTRSRSLSTPPRPTPGIGPKWLSSVLPTPPDSDNGEDTNEVTPPRKRHTRQFASFDFGFTPLLSTPASLAEECKQQRCYEELEEEPEMNIPCVKLKDGRELRPLLKHRKRSASHHIPGSAKWNTSPSPESPNTALPPKDTSPSPSPSPEHHPHVHFSEVENVCVFDESAPAHDSDPTHTPLEPARPRSPPKSPGIKTRQLRLPDTVIASPHHRAALGFTSSAEPSPTGNGSEGGRETMQLTLACDSSLPSAANAPTHGMFTTLRVGLDSDRRSLTGIVRVRNVAFEKSVRVVYTADDWHTRSEACGHWTGAYKLGAEHMDVPPRPDGYDDFEFSIPLGDMGIRGSAGSAVRAKILHFAIKYEVPGQGEWWDNRNGQNWTARFRAVNAGL